MQNWDGGVCVPVQLWEGTSRREGITQTELSRTVGTEAAGGPGTPPPTPGSPQRPGCADSGDGKLQPRAPGSVPQTPPSACHEHLCLSSVIPALLAQRFSFGHARPGVSGPWGLQRDGGDGSCAREGHAGPARGAAGAAARPLVTPGKIRVWLRMAPARTAPVRRAGLKCQRCFKTREGF